MNLYTNLYSKIYFLPYMLFTLYYYILLLHYLYNIGICKYDYNSIFVYDRIFHFLTIFFQSIFIFI